MTQVAAQKNDSFPHKHILSVDDLSIDEINYLYDLTHHYLAQIRQPNKVCQDLSGKTLVNLFFETSTRTRISFELAGKRLGMHVVDFDVETSSLKKDESMRDTFLTLDAMNVDALVIRTAQLGLPKEASQTMDCSLLNGGEGNHAHPTQALFDVFTMQEKLGPIAGKTVAICGDVTHSRVAMSNLRLLTKLGADVRFVGPESLLPETPLLGEVHVTSLAEGIENADVIMMLRIQKERFTGDIPLSDDDFFQAWGLTHEKLKAAKDNVVVMHPGPMNRGIEISGALADDPTYSVILNQVENGVALRMACLKAVCSS